MKKLILLFLVLLCGCTQPVKKIGEIGTPVEMTTNQIKKFNEYSERFTEYSIKYCLYGDNFLKFSDSIQKCDYKDEKYYISDPIPYYSVQFGGGQVEYEKDGDRFFIYRDDEIVYISYADYVGKELVGEEKDMINQLFNEKNNLMIIKRGDYSEYIVSDTSYYERIINDNMYEKTDEKWAMNLIEQARELRQYSFVKHELVFDESKYIK